MNSTDRTPRKRFLATTAKVFLLGLPPAALAAVAIRAGSLAAIGPQWRWWMVLLLLGMALVSASVLALQQLGRIKAPGCGEGGGCAQLTGSRWGKVFGWPVSFLGAAWFPALVAFHVASPPPTPGLLLAAVSAGAVGSLLFLGIIVVYRYFCPYCLMVHSANLTAWLLVVSGPWGGIGRASVVDSVLAAAIFAATTAVLAWARSRTREASAMRRERAFQRSLRRIRKHVHRARKQHLRAQISGRWWRGPQNAAIRLEIYSDYQCPDCRRAENQLERSLAGRCDISVTYKHFPLSRQCNRRLKSPNDHRHACRAARAAEAAGLVGGSKAFLQLHSWLFHQKAEFTDQELAAVLPRIGCTDPAVFFAALDGPEVAERIRQDAEEGIRRGVVGTPAVFVEGVRLEGTTAERAIPRLLDAIGRPPVRPVSSDANANGR
jgi:predicted DsbA family dithiol-disulfide isomerase/uncharacterized membrane protein